MRDYFDSRVAVAGWIDMVEAVSQYGDGVEPIFQSRTVCTNVYTLSQSTYDNQLREIVGQVANHRFAKTFAIFCGSACTYDTDYFCCIQVGIAPVVQ